MGRKLWSGIVPNYGYLTSYDEPNNSLRPFMKEVEVIDVKGPVDEFTANPYYAIVIGKQLYDLPWGTINEEYQVAKLIGGKAIDDYFYKEVAKTKARSELTQKYAWAIPTPEVVQFIRENYLKGGIYEIGAGSGYWARMITQQWEHNDYYAFDDYSTHAFSHRYYNVEEVPILHFEGESIFFCWPTYTQEWAFSQLQAHQPKRVLYVGEGLGGCCAEDKFFDFLETNYIELEDLPKILSHKNIHDNFRIWEKK